MKTYFTPNLRARHLLGLALVLFCAVSLHAQTDYIYNVPGAYYSESMTSNWTSAGTNGILQCDTWSGRGNSDGSGLGTNFMEYWTDKTWSPSYLYDAQVRHNLITGLPSGRYQLQMLVRCYAEDGYPSPEFNVWLYANGIEEPAVVYDNGYNINTYSSQVLGWNTANVEFDVDVNGTLYFGLNIYQQEHQNWVAWKVLHLYQLEAYDEPDPQAEDGTPPDAGTYYIRNRATGRYIMAGTPWGTTVVTGAHGLPTTFIQADNNGNFYLDSGFLNTDNGYDLTQWLYDSNTNRAYMEAAQNNYTFHVVANGEGYYTIRRPDGDYYLGDVTQGAVNCNITNPSLEYAQWELLTREQMMSNLMSGTSSDATFLISNANINTNYANSGWEGDVNIVRGFDDSTGNGSHIIEAWYTNFNVYQTLTNIPNGRYQLTCQGYYRYSNRTDNYNRHSSSATESQLYAKLYAGSSEASIRNIASETNLPSNMKDTSYGGASLPYSVTQAALAFNAGYYANDGTHNIVTVDVTDHTLTIGIKKETTPGTDWTTFKNFELTLLSLGDNTGWDPNEEPEEPEDPYANASPDNPIDMTGKITNPNYSNGTSGWSGSPAIGGMSSNPCAEKFNTTFNVYQTINNLPNGWYRVTAQGYYRYGDYRLEQYNGYGGGGSNENNANNIFAVYTIPYAVLTHRDGTEKLLATMYANNVEEPLPSIFDGMYESNPYYGNFVQTNAYVSQLPADMIGWIPNDMNSGSYAFNQEKYPIEIMVPVTNGTLKIGVKKDFGYKYDWSMWDNWHLYYLGTQDFQYAESVSIDQGNSLTMCVGETRQLTASILPADASDKTLTWRSSNTNIATVDANGLVTASSYNSGSVTITATTNGSEGTSVMAQIAIQVNGAYGDPSLLVINEIQVSNLDMFVDPSNNYGGYVELYNPTDEGVSLNGLKVRLSGKSTEYSLNSNSGVVPAHGYGLIWFDHNDAYDGNVGDHLDMDGGIVDICDYSGNVLLSQKYPAAVSRTSYARTTDGGGTWAFTAYPTPGASNAGSDEFVSDPANRLAEPETSYESRLFDSSFTLNVTIPEGATLRYTLDGSTPTEESALSLNGGDFDIEATTILRLRLFKSGMLPSPVKTLSFIERDKNYMLPVVSLVGNPNDFFSDEMGIFTTGTNGIAGSGVDFRCNWNMEWDRPGVFNYIPADDEQPTYTQEVNVKRFGGWSRSWYPFNFKLKASSLYENRKYVEYPFFDNKPHLKQKVLMMRNGGNDLQCRIKDAALQNIIISSGFYLDCQDYMPVHSFVNGKYQGMLNLREPSNKHFSLANYGIDTDEVDQMELGGGVTVNAGDITAFNQWRNLSSSAGDPTVYEQIKSMVDVDEFINYMATQMFLGGDDWPGNNCKAFKGHDGKFHIVLFDIDQALRFNAYAFTHITNNSSCPLVSIFLNMLRYNAEFRKQFVDTFCIVGGSVFEPTRSLEIINRIAAEMEPALALEGASTEPTAGYVRALMTADRRNTMMNGLRNWSYAQISSATRHEVKLSCNIEQATLQLNGLDIPTAKFDGTMFSPAVIKASAPEGYIFTGWVDTNNEVVSTDEEFDISSWANPTLVATYERLTDTDALFAEIATPIKVNEVSASNTIYVNEYFNRNDWFELYNPTDAALDIAGLYVSNDINNPLKYQIPSSSPINTIVPAKGHIIVWADELTPVSQLHANFKLENIDYHSVVITSSDEFVANNSDFFNNHPAEFRAFVDGMIYKAHRGDNTIGRYPDGGYNFYRMNRPTIDQTNTLTQADEVVGHDVCLMDPDFNKFRLELVEGWNWISHNLKDAIAVNDLSPNAERIVGARQEAIRDNQALVGSLGSLTAGNLYKVQMSQDDTYEYEGLKCNTGTPISLKAGWNWVGYTVTGAQTLDAAMANNLLEPGDQIMGQDGWASYNNGHWTGSLAQLETGKGYMFKSKSAKTLRFHAPGVQVNFSKRRARAYNALHQQYGINQYAYPNVMGMVAQLVLDGMPVEAERFTLLAYAGEECRGLAKAIDNHHFFTMYGKGGERLRYHAIDNLDGGQYDIEESDTFVSDIVGTTQAPRILTLTLDSDDATGIDSSFAVNTTDGSGDRTVVGYYSLDGVLMGNRTATLAPGLYLVRYANGTCEKLLIP